MRVAIVGSREWPDPSKVRERVLRYVGGLPDGTVVVSGGAPRRVRRQPSEMHWRRLEQGVR